MRRAVLAVVGLCACSNAFGLTQPAPQGVPIDARPSCPAIGMLPAFKSSPVQVAFRPDCNEYVIAADTQLGLATCQVDQTTMMQAPHVEIALGDGTFANVPEFAPTMNPTLSAYYQQAMIAPEGDTVIVQHYDQNAPPAYYSYWRYHLQAGGTWQPEAAPITLPTQVGSVSSYGSPSRGPKRHWLVEAADATTFTPELFELVDDGRGTLSVASETPLSSLSPNISNATSPSLSDDGLRAVFSNVQYGSRLPPFANPGIPTVFGQDTGLVYYMDRTTITDAFGPPVPLASAPLTGDPFMNPNCARMYFSGIGSIWYVEQP